MYQFQPKSNVVGVLTPEKIQIIKDIISLCILGR